MGGFWLVSKTLAQHFLMARYIKKTILFIAIGYGVLVAINYSIPLVVNMGNCPEPLNVRVVSNRSDVSQVEFEEFVNKAIAEWESKTSKDLFTIILDNQSAGQKEIISPITLEQVKTDPFGLTWRRYNGTRMQDFKTEIYAPEEWLYPTILHELGHGRGLKDGHLTNPEDIMSAKANKLNKDKLSKADINYMINYCDSKFEMREVSPEDSDAQIPI